MLTYYPDGTVVLNAPGLSVECRPAGNGYAVNDLLSGAHVDCLDAAVAVEALGAYTGPATSAGMVAYVDRVRVTCPECQVDPYLQGCICNAAHDAGAHDEPRRALNA